MTDIDLNQYRRIYLTLADNKDGRVRLRATYARPPHGAYMVALMSAGMMASPNVELLLVSDAAQNPALRGPAGKDGANGTNGRDGTNGKDGAPGPAGTAIVANIEVVERALVAIALGLRTITTPCPGAIVGQPVFAVPTAALPAGYAIHNAWVPAKDTVALRITGPSLALGASATLSLAIARIG